MLVNQYSIFCSTIYKEHLETTIEDATLSMVVAQATSMIESGGTITLMPLVVKINRLNLCIREICIPMLAGSATIAVLIMDSLSVKNILLNFLALSFLVSTQCTCTEPIR